MSKVEEELARRAAYKLPAQLHPDTPRGPDVTAVDRQAIITAIAAKLQARMVDVVELIYKREPESGRWWNIDGETGRILFGLPWAEYSHREWGLYRSESDMLRMIVRSQRTNHGGPFYFVKRSRKWYVDLAAFPTLQALKAKPDAWVITPAWVLAADDKRRSKQVVRHAR